MHKEVHMSFRFRSFTAAFGIAAIALFLSGTVSSATVYRCTDAKEEAILGSNRSVSSNHGNSRCRWSVEGASTEKRPEDNAAVQSRTRNALNALTGQRFDMPGSSQFKQFLAELLIGPFEGREISRYKMGLFENVVGSSAGDFGSCIRGSGHNSSFSNNDRLCKTISPEGDRVFIQWSMEVLPTEPLLVMGVTLDRERYMLFVPLRYLASRFQFQ
jgi:hypothetical protein